MNDKSSWLNDLIEMTREAESPKIFMYWAGLSVLSAIAKKNIYLDKHYYHLYPNVYVMLVARSGGRKGFPISVAKSLVSKINQTKVISGQNSIQAVIRELSKQWTSEDGSVKKGAECFLVSEEFTTFLVDDDSALSLLTTLYDTHAHKDGWVKTLKGTDGQEKLKDVCITMLTASNPTHFKDKVTSVDINGGFVGRLLIIDGDQEKRKVNPLVYKPEIIFDPTSLIPYLNELSRVKGEFKYTSEGADCFIEWYTQFRTEVKDDDNTGTAERLHDQVLKVAMLISLSKDFSLLFRADDINEAIDECLGFTRNIKKLTSGIGKSQLAPQVADLIQFLLLQPECKTTRQKLLKKFYMNMDAFDLDRMVVTLTGANILQLPMNQGSDVIYRLSQEFVTTYKSNKQKENN